MKLVGGRISLLRTSIVKRVVAPAIALIILIAALSPILCNSQILESRSLTMAEKAANNVNGQINQTLGANETFAFYYPWYGTPSLSGYWRHWNDSNHNPDNITNGRRDIAATDYPQDDVYDSNNETVIDQQVREAKDAGINCFVISWWGINTFEDKASKHIVNVCQQDDFNFTFYIENTTTINEAVQDIDYLLSTYSNNTSWYSVNGRPVIFVYQRARDNLNPQTWNWHACTDSIGNDNDSSSIENASTQWLPAEEVRAPPRLGIVPIQPFQNTSGYIVSSSPIYLESNEQYYLNFGISDIRNDSQVWSDVGMRVEIGLDSKCNDTLFDQIVNFTDGWIDESIPINMTRYAGKSIYLKAESYNGGLVNWSSEWAAVDYLFINNSKGEIVSPDPYFDNGWKDVISSINEQGANPYVIMDFGGYETQTKTQDFMEYFSGFIDGIHMYNPIGFSNNLLGLYDLYDQASELAHSYDKTFIASVVPGFNNTVASDYISTSLESVVDRRNGATYDSFWLIANASHPDGYAITSFNEWHEGTEIEPSIEYTDQYLNLTKEILKTGAQTASAAQALPFAVNYLVRNYNSTIGLIPDVPRSSTYWLYSDNFLASYTLWRYDPTNLTLENIVTNISKSISKYIQALPDPLNQYMVLNSSIAAFNASTDYTITYDGDAIIRITLNNGTGPLNPSDYADIAFLEALYDNRIGQVQDASYNYQIGANMSNGMGLNDTIFQGPGPQKGQYQTYKLALYIYCSKVLGQGCPQIAEATLLKMQAASGGFYTGYDENYSINGTNTNVETTSLAILALLELSGAQATLKINVTVSGTITQVATNLYHMDSGASATFTAEAQGGTQPYSYIWYINGTANSSNQLMSFTAQQTGTYSIKVNVTDSESPIQQLTSQTITVTVPEYSSLIIVLLWTAIPFVVLARKKKSSFGSTHSD